MCAGQTDKLRHISIPLSCIIKDFNHIIKLLCFGMEDSKPSSYMYIHPKGCKHHTQSLSLSLCLSLSLFCLSLSLCLSVSVFLSHSIFLLITLPSTLLLDYSLSLSDV